MTSSSVIRQPSVKVPLRGVYAASLTPCKPDLSCDARAMAEHCQELISRGCSGVLIFGTTGEGSSFSVEERKRALKSLIESGLNPGQLMVCISCCAIADAVELAQDALKYHCAAVLIIPPFFYKGVNDEGVVAFYREVILRVGKPELRVILYHIPQLSGVPITVKMIDSLLADFPDQVIGIKESEGNMNLIREIRNKFPQFSIFVGNEKLITEAVQLGAAGSIAGMANAFPELLRSLYDFGEGSGKRDENEKMEAIRGIVRQFPFIPALKSIMEEGKGSAWRTLRPPLVPMGADQRRALSKGLSTISL